MTVAEVAPTLDVGRYVRSDEGGRARLDLMVENLHCAGCVNRIERTLRACPGVIEARVNLSTGRLRLAFDPRKTDSGPLIDAVAEQGYRLLPFDASTLESGDAAEERRLLRALAVAGFAAANVMLLSVSVWSGAGSADMGPATRTLMYWLSALIALPAIAYAGRPFFYSAAAALGARRLNMDVPISLAILLAAGMSLHETAVGGAHAYFDAAVMLLFLLLVGRYLDRRARSRARSAAERMSLLESRAVKLRRPDGTVHAVPVDEVAVGALVTVAAGERVPVDGVVESGRSTIDTGLVTGESTPSAAAPGAEVFAGTINLGHPIEVRVSAVGGDTLLGEIVRLMESAEQGRARYVRLADRAARLYAPLIHGFALATFLGWIVLGGASWQGALLIAISVLIITCPCALGLAVPAVQVVASGRLMQRGIMVKSGDALERLAEVDHVVLDKTGTVTLGRPRLVNGDDIPPADLALAAKLARASTHPLAAALAEAAAPAPAAAGVREEPGLGLEAVVDGARVRLGQRAWCGVADCGSDSSHDAATPGFNPGVWLSRPGHAPRRFVFEDRPRSDAGAVVGALTAQGLSVEMLSGDHSGVVAAVARGLGIPSWRAEVKPPAKVAHLEALARARRKVLMIGDGLNDAPALAAAHVSMSPARAADISRTAADIVFQGERLAPVLEAIEVARASRRLVLQNFGLAFAYNLLALPLAIAGQVTPLIAAAAMSASSLVVTLNALRLRGRTRRAAA